VSGLEQRWVPILRFARDAVDANQQPTFDEIATETGLEPMQVRNAVMALRDDGWLRAYFYGGMAGGHVMGVTGKTRALLDKTWPSVEADEVWRDMECGAAVVRVEGSRPFLLSWFPHAQSDPSYPGFTVEPDFGFPTDGGVDAVFAWVRDQPWAKTCLGDSATVVGVGKPSAVEEYVPVGAEKLDAPVEEWTELRDQAAEFGWFVAATREPDDSYSWAVWDARRGVRLQHGIAPTWDDARLAMIENLHPPSGEK
jgi:hypothetical protein